MRPDRCVVITGGTGSLGYRTARLLAQQDWSVVITGRDRASTADAARTLAQQTAGAVYGLPLNLTSLADVRRFVNDLAERELPPLRAIVCNAGIQIVSGASYTADGMETTFVVNHLAQFLLVQLLVPAMSAPGRIVIVASDTHDPRRHTGMPAPRYTDAHSLAYPAAPDGENPTVAGRRRYTTSKLCNVLLTYELDRRLRTGKLGPMPITVNAFDPGLMPGTGLARDYSGIQAFAWRYLLPALTVVPGINVHTPGKSAEALARLVTDPALETTSGQYFSGFRTTRSSTDSYDRAKAIDLWRTSIELAGLGSADGGAAKT
ncbi:MAG TPA: SDR family NAD(P)-dependent oxidoreductase [Mycobacterium sp.]|uniref:SDR family NAD(P)-dependent oxidoreductase n=1 Tax=Mycobacterium sp. TaxID=1785 RepID=UPI002D56D316|nr:SDR family NAD(P)-dependent oxidoreductase [Mycobacterium sp.]HZU49352.1 SDR family NAD(P)-dependent oxidoreductase [Mycobacterium sp.]